MNCLHTPLRCLPPQTLAAVRDLARARAVQLHDRAVQDAITRVLRAMQRTTRRRED